MTSENKQAITKQRIALYGGGFDPVHNAHMAVARSVLGQQELDRLIFIPAAQSPLKENGPQAKDADRVKMLELAISDEPRFSVDECELERGGVSYSVDTVRAFREREPEAEFYWVLGGDQFEQLDRWHAIEEFAALVTFLVVARPTFRLNSSSVPGLVWRQVDAPLMDESSSLVRQACSVGASLEGLVPEAVGAFIRAERLYT